MFFYLAMSDCHPPCRIKIDKAGSAVLAFTGREVAESYLRTLNIQGICSVIDATAIPESGKLTAERLLVFHSPAHIEEAYRDQAGYDFSKHIETWPPDAAAT